MAEYEAPIDNLHANDTHRTETEDELQTLPPKPLDEISKPPDNNDVDENERNSKLALLLNISNLLAYGLNASLTYYGGLLGVFGGKSNAALSSEYQTLVTPSATYFGYIWSVIFLSQAFFAIAQLFIPRYRNHALVQRGVGVWYILACVSQAAWIVAFGYEYMVLAFVSMVSLLLCLLTILGRQWKFIDEIEKTMEGDEWLLANNAVNVLDEDQKRDMGLAPSFGYLLLRFPFAIHAGWIAPATPLMLSVVMVSYGADPQVELWTAVIGVAVLFGMSMGLLLRQERGAPSYSFSAVVAYAFAGIAWELNAPSSDDILERFTESEISLTKNVAGFCCAMLLVTIVSRFFAICMRDHCCYKSKKYDDEDEDVIYVEADDV